jgi:hypothetical protein
MNKEPRAGVVGAAKTKNVFLLEGPMTTLIGTVTLAGTIFGALIGQISTGAEFAGVIIASLVLMSLRDARD